MKEDNLCQKNFVRNEKIKVVEVASVNKITLVRGDGTPKDPVRQVVQYWDLNGKLINDIENN